MSSVPQEKRVQKGMEPSVCHFQYSFDCKGNKINSKNFITKIRKNDAFSENETRISKIIVELEHYDDYFAPVLDSCELTLANLNDNEITKCELIDIAKPQQKYKSNRVAYVGEDTLDDYIVNTFIHSPYRMIPAIMNSYLYVLHSIIVLNDNRIIHCNIKETGILCNRNGTPVLCNFHKSILITESAIDILSYRKLFEYHPQQENLCLEYQVLSFLFSKPDTEWNTRITQEDINTVLDAYYSKTVSKTIFKHIAPSGDKFRTYFNTFIGQTVGYLVEALIPYASHWTNYSLAVVYLHMLDDIHIRMFYTDYPFLKTFTDTLITLVTSTPDKTRPTIHTTYDSIHDLFSAKIDKGSSRKVEKIIDEIVENRELNEKIIQNFKKTKLYLLQHE